MWEEIERTIRDTVESSDEAIGSPPIWRSPLVKAVSAGNPGFPDLKRLVSKNHLLPTDVLEDAKSVICFFVPFGEKVVTGNSGGERASRGWAQAYILTNELISRIGDAVGTLMHDRGFEVGKIPATHNFDEVELVSDWSHRHVAHIAGLGSFGLNNMLITDRGCCGRLGSLVTNREFDRSPVDVGRERCLFRKNGTCGICRRKCIAGAYEEVGFNRKKCYEICLENAAYHADIGYADVCGKCVVGLPCSSRDPSAPG